MKNLVDAAVESVFIHAHEYVQTIDAALEELETAILKGDYPSASEAFGTALRTTSNDLLSIIETDLGRLCDAINPEYQDTEET